MRLIPGRVCSVKISFSTSRRNVSFVERMSWVQYGYYNTSMESGSNRELTAARVLLMAGFLGGGGGKSGSGNWNVAGLIPGLHLAMCRGVPEQDADPNCS